MKITRLKMLILFCVIVVGSLMGEGFNASSQPYRYGGKELVTLGGLNLSYFGARWLDSPSGTFTTMDPLCEKYTQYSPYLYCAGNPIKMLFTDNQKCDIKLLRFDKIGNIYLVEVEVNNKLIKYLFRQKGDNVTKYKSYIVP